MLKFQRIETLSWSRYLSWFNLLNTKPLLFEEEKKKKKDEKTPCPFGCGKSWKSIHSHSVTGCLSKGIFKPKVPVFTTLKRQPQAARAKKVPKSCWK